MNHAALLSYPIPEIRQMYRGRDAVLYALSVGASHWADHPRGLDFLTDTRGPAVLPSYVVDLGHPGFWLGDPATTVDATRVVHAEEGFTVFAPLPPQAEVIGRTRIVDIIDKGAEKGALMFLAKEVSDAASGQLLARVEGVDSGRGQDDTLRLPRPSFAPCLSPVVAIVVAMSAAHPFRGCEDGKI